MLSMLLFIFLVIAGFTAIAENVIFKSGDWLIYKFSITGIIGSTSFNCSFWLRIEILEINATDGIIVSFNQTLKEVGPSDEICSHFASMFSQGVFMLNISSLKPESGAYFIDPSYNGIFKMDSGNIEYYKGVLKKGEVSNYGINITLELSDTSITSLKPIQQTLQYILIVLSTIIIISAVGIFILLRQLGRFKPKSATGTPKPLESLL